MCSEAGAKAERFKGERAALNFSNSENNVTGGS